MDAVVYYHVFDPITAVISVTNLSNSTKLLAATTLRKILGAKLLQELLTDRENISHNMQVDQCFYGYFLNDYFFHIIKGTSH